GRAADRRLGAGDERKRMPIDRGRAMALEFIGQAGNFSLCNLALALEQRLKNLNALVELAADFLKMFYLHLSRLSHGFRKFDLVLPECCLLVVPSLFAMDVRHKLESLRRRNRQF